MPLELVATPTALADLGETGLAFVSERMSDHLAECLTCGHPLADAPATVTTNVYDGGHVMVRAHHAQCPPPRHSTFDTTYVFSPLKFGDKALLLIHPSVEMLWLRQQTTGKRNHRRWEDTTATAFTELGFQSGQPGQDLVLQPIPNATVQCTNDLITVDVPPTHRWSTTADPHVVAAIRRHGQAMLVLSTGTDQRDLDDDKLNRVFSAGDYVAGLVDHAPIGHPRVRQAGRVELHHPQFVINSPTVNAHTVFLDDPHVGWAAALLHGDSMPRRAGVDIDRIPVALLETPSSITIGQQPGDYLVDAMVSSGLSRLNALPAHLTPAPGWRMHYTSQQLCLRSPEGVRIIGRVTPEPQWLSAALGHRFVLALYGPVLGVRDVEEEGTRSFDAADRHLELTAAIEGGLVAGGLVEFSEDDGPAPGKR